MGTRFAAQRRGNALGLACWGLIGGCNAVLGIDEPAPGLRAVDPGGGALDADIHLVNPGSGDPDAGEDGATEEPQPPSEHAWADWPMPNPGAGVANPQIYSAKVDGVVADSVTQLEWQQSVDDQLRTWEEAVQYCAELELAGGGFRLPARIELLSLIDYTRANPSIDPIAFPDAPWDRFWTSSRFAGTRTSVWLISFEFGTGFSLQSHQNEKHRVRCVR